jgi:pyruvate,orthophosphate dikinase
MDTPTPLKSKALEINLADYHIDVDIDPKYSPLQEVMHKYFGLMEGVNTFLRELSHPFMNWRFIVTEARRYSLDYFHLFCGHPKGPEAAGLMAGILVNAVLSAKAAETQSEALDNLLLYLQKILKDSGADVERFRPVVTDAFERIRHLPEDAFALFVRSYTSIQRVAAAGMDRMPPDGEGIESLNRLLVKCLEHTYAYWIGEGDPRVRFERESAEFGLTEACDDLFNDVSLRQIGAWQRSLGRLRDNAPMASRETTPKLLELPDFNHFVETYRSISQGLLQQGPHDGRGHHLKLIFLFQIMNVSGLASIHEETLREINRTLTWIIVNENYPTSKPHPQDLCHSQGALPRLCGDGPQLHPQHRQGCLQDPRCRPGEFFHRRPDRLRVPGTDAAGRRRPVADPGQQRPPAQHPDLACADQTESEAVTRLLSA